MKSAALMKVRDEQWVLPLSLPAALRVCDIVVIADHGSIDATPDIIAQTARDHPARVVAFRVEPSNCIEADLTQRLLETARDHGATHMVPVDADEVLSSNHEEPFRAWLAELAPAQSLWLPWVPLWRSLDRWRNDDSVWSKGRMLVAFRDAPHIAYLKRADGYQIHARWVPELMENILEPVKGCANGGLLHLQFADWRRLRAKHAWYKMTEQVDYPGRSTVQELERKYNQALDETGIRLAPADPEWWASHPNRDALITLGQAPWHERECRRFWRENDHALFDGLTLWGVPQAAPEEVAHAL